MDNPIAKRLVPHLITALIMVVVTSILFAPAMFSGKVLKQGDNVRAYAMQGEINDLIEKGEGNPLWTNSMFAGMPTFQIKQPLKGNFTKPIYRTFLLFQPITSAHIVVLLAMLCCYFLLLTLKIDWRIAAIGAIAFGICNYNIDLAEAGHSTKQVAIAFAPGVIAGVLLAFRGKYLLGAGIFGLFFAMELYANHLQITFYLGLILAILGLIKLIEAARRGVLPNFGKAAGVLLGAALLALLCNTSRLWPTYEYSQETIRGKSELASKKAEGKADGLTKDYIWAWSYGIKESMTLLIPNFMGGGASQHFRGTTTHSRLYKNIETNLIQQGYPRDQAKKSAEQQIASLFYWGDQPFVGVAIYFGAVLLFLFVLGAILYQGNIKWWLLISALFTLSIAWGGNFFLNDILVDYFPLFNKFRAVSMALGLSQLAVVILAMMGLQKIMDPDIKLETKKKAVMYAAGGVGGLCLLAILFGMGMDFSNAAKDGRLQAELVSLVKADRASVMRADAIRSLVLILGAAGLIWAYLSRKLSATLAILLVGLLAVGDSLLVDKRILYSEKFEKEQTGPTVQPSSANLEIQNDNDPHFRVLDLSAGTPFKNANTSYFHKSIGGYHAAKLMRFQEVAERYLDPDYGQNPTAHMNILNMLNTKYLIQGGQGGPPRAQKNAQALGNAWFVPNFTIADDADAELNALDNLNPAQDAVFHKSQEGYLSGLTLQKNPSDRIALTSYYPDRMEYIYSAQTEQLAIFSEVYYPPSKGWSLYIDGEKQPPMARANYLLRAARLPAGTNRKLEMVFEPKSFYVGENISRIASALLILLFFGAMYLALKDRGLPEVEHLLDHEPEVKKPVKKTVSKKAAKKKKKKG